MPHFIKLTLLLCIFTLTITAQTVCKGTLGDPVYALDFGRGVADFGPPISAATTNYNYTTGTPNDGQYAIAQNTFGMHNSPGNGWHQIINHTPGDDNGYMMIVNASNNPGIFFQASIPNLCANTTYEFAAWIINLLDYPANKPNISFEIYDTQGNLLSSPYKTGDIPENTTPQWKQYGLIFTTPANVTSVVLKMINNGPGGIGNDIALDDITFRPCGPVVAPTVDGLMTEQAYACVGDTKSFLLSANIGTGFNNLSYQWQIFANNTWTDIQGATSNQYPVTLANATKATYKYRLAVAEGTNIGSLNCRVVSPAITISVVAPPTINGFYNYNACIGRPILLTVEEGATYSWTGPNGFTSTERNPIIPNATHAMEGTYTVVVANEAGCKNTAETIVTVDEPPTASIGGNAAICEGEQVALNASGGKTYTWLPAKGLSATNIPNPIASPTETTTYKVTIANGACEATLEVTVTVIKKVSTDAGEDKKILKDSQVQLNGKVDGPYTKFYWTPSDYLDDATKLNPMATPPHDITYTLHAENSGNCPVSSDKVVIKVYENLNIPNTFSPNGDGQNDIWNISPLEPYPKASIKVMNRSGEILYHATGSNHKPWDGKFNGKPVPVGVYYYLIQLEPSIKAVSGWVMLVR